MRHPQAAYLLRAPCDDAAEIIEQYANAANANTWLAAALRALCDKSKKRANLFVQELMEAESVEPQISTSGIDVAERIRLAVTERDRVDQEQEWETLQSTVYLNAGMSEIDVRLAIKKIASKMRVVPVHRKEAPHALMRTIVANMPSQPPALADEKKKYLAVLDRAEKLREPPTLESQPLDVTRLTEWIVVDIAQHSTPAQRAESEVSSAERRKQRNERFKNHKGPCTTCAVRWRSPLDAMQCCSLRQVQSTLVPGRMEHAMFWRVGRSTDLQKQAWRSASKESSAQHERVPQIKGQGSQRGLGSRI